MTLAHKRYFFLNGTLHKELKYNRHADIMTCFDYGDEKVKSYIGSDVLKKREPAFNAYAVGKISGRVRRVVRQWRGRGLLPEPHIAYSLNKPEHVVDIFWTAEQAWQIWEIFSNVHVGRPRKDGEITPSTPSRMEARSLIEGGRVLYFMDDDGELQPTWRA